MAETVKKAKAPAKRKSTTKKSAAPKQVAPVQGIHLAPAQPSYDQVAELARKYWAERGYQDGHDEEDWFRAEQELRSKAS